MSASSLSPAWIRLPLNRRDFFRRSGRWSLWIAAAASADAGCAPAPPGPESPLSASERRVAVVLGDTLFPGGGDLPLKGSDVDVTACLERYLREAEPVVGRALRLVLWLFDLLALFHRGGFRRFTSLSPEERDRYLVAWETSRVGLLRAAYKGIKAVYAMGYFNDPRVLERMGFFTVCPEP